MNNQNSLRKAYILMKDDPGKIQVSSSIAAKELVSMIKTCLGPHARQKILITKNGSIEVTNDGNSILRELDVSHPSARCLIELSQTQDDECGDGTTSVLVLASEMLYRLSVLIKEMHPSVIIDVLNKIRKIALKTIEDISTPIAEQMVVRIVESAVSTKLCSYFKIPFHSMAIEAVKTIKDENNNINLKENFRVVKVTGDLEKCSLFHGVVVMKEIQRFDMKKLLHNPIIVIVDFPIEYKKIESAANMEFVEKEDIENFLKVEELQIRNIVYRIKSLGADMVVAEKGICDLALGMFAECGITALRRFRRSDTVLIAKTTSAAIVSRPEDLSEKCIGMAEEFCYREIGKDGYCFFKNSVHNKVVTVLISAPSKDLSRQLERDLMDAIKVAKNLSIYPKIVPGGGALELSVVNALNQSNLFDDGFSSIVRKMVCRALESIPSILAVNAGSANSLELIHKALAEHKKGNFFVGINGNTATICDCRNVIMDPAIVKQQSFKSAFDSVIQLLRVDSIIECSTAHQ